MAFNISDFAFGSAPGILADGQGSLSNNGMGLLDSFDVLKDQPLNNEFLSGLGNSNGPDVSDFNFGMNMPTLKLGLGALGTLGGLYTAFQGMGLAQDKLDFIKETTQTNLANEIQSYNTRLGDKARTAQVINGWTDERTSNYISNNNLSD